MKHSLFRHNVLACFSPPVMLATFLFEVGSALYVLWRHRLTAVSRLAIVVLLMLAVFQLAEYNVCETAWGLSSLDWARFGFVAITALPPLGVHLVAAIAERAHQYRWLIRGSYMIGGVFGALFLTAGHGMSGGDECLGNYVLFHVAPHTMKAYAFYYYGLLLAGVGLSLHLAGRARKKATKHGLHWLAVGYTSFILPTTAVNIIDPSTIAGIPSIMCGFAVLLAVIMVSRVVPLTQPRRLG